MDTHNWREYADPIWMGLDSDFAAQVPALLKVHGSGDELSPFGLTISEMMNEGRARSGNIMPPRETRSREELSTKASHAQLIGEVVRCHLRLRSLENRLAQVTATHKELVAAVALRQRALQGTHRSLESAFERLGKFAQLDDDWDQDGAIKLTPRALAIAYKLIFCVAEPAFHPSRAELAPSTSAPIADGGIQIEWEGERSRIEVQVNPDGSLGYLIVRGKGDAAEYEETDVAPLSDVVRLIKNVVGEGIGPTLE